MNMEDILDGDLLSINWQENKTYAALKIITVEGKKARINAIALDGTGVQIFFHCLDFTAGRSTHDGRPCLGEIEALLFSPTRLTIEGDFGCFEVVAGRIEIAACEASE